MRIAIPTFTSTPTLTGVAEYLTNLINGLQALDNRNEYFILTCPENRYMFSLRNKNFREVVVNLPYKPYFIMAPVYHLWQRFVFVQWCRRNRIDLVHLPNLLFVTSTIKTVVTIHDLAEFYYPRYSRLRNWLRRNMVMTAIRHAEKIIAVSLNTQADLEKLGSRNVICIYNGFRAETGNANNAEDYLKSLGLNKGEYFIYVGSLIKHKNVTGLVNAFSKYRAEYGNAKLVIVGNRGNDYDEVVRCIGSNNLRHDVILMGYVEQDAKSILIRSAKALCLVSFYEGFGFPVLEAQSLGTPVIISSTSCLPEISGGAALQVDPTNIDQIALAMKKMDDGSFAGELSIKGLGNPARFSWDVCAAETLNIYNSLGNGK